MPFLLYYSGYKGNNQSLHCSVHIVSIIRGSIGIHVLTLKVPVAVTSEGVAWCTRKQFKAFLVVRKVGNVFYWLALAIHSIFAAQVAEVILLFTLASRQTILKANRATALLYKVKYMKYRLYI